ncbi:hypothetical protein CLOM_g1660 [Closterium sp. NIES-68]|nr:hypothetical protein CLOM_g1660 [Closterium sp. NIES-68]GJP76022.1 hypothetical protein CLOP_g6418 [Closterium sp. NIES-67]
MAREPNGATEEPNGAADAPNAPPDAPNAPTDAPICEITWLLMMDGKPLNEASNKGFPDRLSEVMRGEKTGAAEAAVTAEAATSSPLLPSPATAAAAAAIWADGDSLA